jgi:hypothetical protein
MESPFGGSNILTLIGFSVGLILAGVGLKIIELRR